MGSIWHGFRARWKGQAQGDKPSLNADSRRFLLVLQILAFFRGPHSSYQRVVQGKCPLHFLNLNGVVCSNTLFSNTSALPSSLLFWGNSTCKILEHLVCSNTSGFQFWGPLARTNFLSALYGLPNFPRNPSTWETQIFAEPESQRAREREREKERERERERRKEATTEAKDTHVHHVTRGFRSSSKRASPRDFHVQFGGEKNQ